jgi:CheY-like chemotaxis protein
VLAVDCARAGAAAGGAIHSRTNAILMRTNAAASAELGFLAALGGTGLERRFYHMPTAGNILIVEDDPDTREMVTSLLATEGFHVVAAEDGLEALHLLRTVQHRAPDVPCLVLLDLSMPRLGGNEFRRAQLGDPRVAGVPVAVMSGATDAEARALGLGAVATLTKPLDFDALLRVVRLYCAPGQPKRDLALDPVSGTGASRRGP